MTLLFSLKHYIQEYQASVTLEKVSFVNHEVLLLSQTSIKTLILLFFNSITGKCWRFSARHTLNCRLSLVEKVQCRYEYSYSENPHHPNGFSKLRIDRDSRSETRGVESIKGGRRKS